MEILTCVCIVMVLLSCVLVGCEGVVIENSDCEVAVVDVMMPPSSAGVAPPSTMLHLNLQ